MKISKQITRILKYRELFLLSLPGIIIIIIFKYIPLYGLILPFKDFRYDLGFWKSQWVGFENFRFLFHSADAWIITRNTVMMNACFIIINLTVAIAFSLMLYELSRRWVKFFQTVMFFPYFLSWMVVTYIFLAALDMDYGFINSILKVMGFEPVLWYNEPSYWIGIMIFANAWKNVGYSTLLYYAHLLSIDSELFESAKIDGANRFQVIKGISIPMLVPLMTILIVLQVGKIFYGNFDMFYNLPRDNPLLYSTTDVIDTFVFRALRNTGDIGMASAAGTYQAVVGFVLVLVTNLAIRKTNSENALF